MRYSVRFAVVSTLGLALALGGCASSDHPDPPPAESDPRTPLASPIEIAAPRSDLTVAQLNALGERQAELFAVYRLRHDDQFSLRVGDQEPTRHTVLTDGTVFVGALQRSISVIGRTVEELRARIIYGDPPLAPCGNCGYFYDPTATNCAVCRATRDNELGSALLTFSEDARATFAELGRPIGPVSLADDGSEALPIRRTATGDAIVLCREGIARVRPSAEPLGAATVVWSRALGRLRMEHAAFGAPRVPDPTPVLVGQTWYLVDLETGALTPDNEGVARFVVEVPDQPEPNGLIARYRRPLVAIEGLELAPTSLSVKIVGAVNKPGRVRLLAGARLLDAITDAGGPIVQSFVSRQSSTAPPADPIVDFRHAVLMRERHHVPDESIPDSVGPRDLVRLSVDFEKLFMLGDSHQNILLFPGDVVYLPQYAPHRVAITVIGEVARSGVYYFSDRPHLVEAMASAGWVLEDTAKESAVYLVRDWATPSRARVYLVNLGALATGQAENIWLKDDDYIYVDTDALTDISRIITKLNPLISQAAVWPANAIIGYDAAFEALRSGN